MQQQVQEAPAPKVQLMGSINTLLAGESEELKIKVVNIVFSLDPDTCAGLMALAETTRKGFLLQLAREQAAAGAGTAVVSSATFKRGMKTLGDEQQAALAAQEKRLSQQQKAALDEQQAALAAQEKRLSQQQKAALDKALADQKREILESIGQGVPTRKEAMIRVVLLLILAVVAGMLDWRPWVKDSKQQYPWASFTSNVLKAAASIFVLLPTSSFLTQQQQKKWYERLQSVFKS